MFRQFLDTSFSNYRQVRVVVQELPLNPTQAPSLDFQTFSTSLFNHKAFKYRHCHLEYCFIRESLAEAEASLNEIQLYRRPFAWIFFTTCRTSGELRLVLDSFTQIKQQRAKDAFVHLFVRYRNVNSKDEDGVSIDDKLDNETNVDSDYVPSARPSISSMISIDSATIPSQSWSSFQSQDSIPADDSISPGSESLSNSFNSSPVSPDVDDDLTGSVSISLTQSKEPTKKLRPSLLKSRSIPTIPRVDVFDGELKRILQSLEEILSKHTIETKGMNASFLSIDSHLADIRLMIEDTKDCSLLEQSRIYRHGILHDRVLKSVLELFDMRIMQILINQYLKANDILGSDAIKNKVPKKIVDARTIKRRADCYLLLGDIRKAYQEYKTAASTLRTQNDLVWHAAALEARIAASHSSTQESKPKTAGVLSVLRQNSWSKIQNLSRSMKKFGNRSDAPLHFQSEFETIRNIYSTANRSLFNQTEFRLELDACIRWCSLLWEQNDIRKYRTDIDEYITRIDALGSSLEQHLDRVYLNAYLAETFAFIGLQRKSALHYRSAAFSGLTLLSEEGDHPDQIGFFDELIQEARQRYGINDNQLTFPWIQKTILNESIQISWKKKDFTTIIENVRFAIESLLDYMNDVELEALLAYFKASDQLIACSYCSIPRLKSLELLPLSDRFKVWRTKEKELFIYSPLKTLPTRHRSLQRKVDFFWVKNEQVQIALEFDNYLPATLTIDQFEFLTDNNSFSTKLERKYHIRPRTIERLLICCTPEATGCYQIQGLRYHIWSTNQEFRFADFPTIRHCACSVEVVEQLPLLDVQHLFVNDQKLELIEKSTVYTAQIHRGEDLFVTLGLINSSSDCEVDTLEVQVFVYNSDMSDYIRITPYNLPILAGGTSELKINLTEIYDRCLWRHPGSKSTIDFLTMELRLDYSNDLSKTNGYHRQTRVELRLDYLSPVTFEINDIQNNDDDSSYLICCTINNHLSEAVQFANHLIEPSKTSSISIEQKKIPLHTFPLDLTQLIQNVRTQLPSHIHYKTTTANKQLRLPIDWQTYSNENIQSHLTALIQSPYQCYWHFERTNNTLHIHLCVQFKYDQLSKVEFVFPTSNGVQYLNSNRIIFNNIQSNEYYRAERIVIFSPENNSDVLVVDVNINGIPWKRITLTF